MLVRDEKVRGFIESEHLPTGGMTRTAIASDLIPKEQVVSVLAASVAMGLNLAVTAVVLKEEHPTFTNSATDERVHRDGVTNALPKPMDG